VLAWLRRSLDVIPTDFVMLEHVKEHIYAVPPRTVDDLDARLPAADTAVDTGILGWVHSCNVTAYRNTVS
jgi:hypothetical protein